MNLLWQIFLGKFSYLLMAKYWNNNIAYLVTLLSTSIPVSPVHIFDFRCNKHLEKANNIFAITSIVIVDMLHWKDLFLNGQFRPLFVYFPPFLIRISIKIEKA